MNFEAQLFLLHFEFGSGLDTKLEDVGALSVVVDDHETVYLWPCLWTMKQIGPREFWKQVMMENYSKEAIIFIVAKTGRKKSAWSLVMTDLKWQNTAVWHFPWSIDRYQNIDFILRLA